MFFRQIITICVYAALNKRNTLTMQACQHKNVNNYLQWSKAKNFKKWILTNSIKLCIFLSSIFHTFIQVLQALHIVLFQRNTDTSFSEEEGIWNRILVKKIKTLCII